MDVEIPDDLASESRLILQEMARRGLLGYTDDDATIDGIRLRADRERPLMGSAPAVARVEDIEIGGPAGRVVLRLYHASDEPPSLLLLWIHGGGWSLGSLDLADADCSRLCRNTGALVVSVDYRLAPEHRFPAGLHDVEAALGWVDAELRAPSERVPRLVVGGESAGANLAAALCLLARDRGGPAIDHQLLICPATDSACDTASHREFADGYLLTHEDTKYFWNLYVGLPELARDPLASVLRAADHAGLPPATLVIAGCDVLRDDGEAYAERLAASGVPVEVLRYPGQLHGFWSYAAMSEAFTEAINEEIRNSLRRLGSTSRR